MIADRLRKSILQSAFEGKLSLRLGADGDAKEYITKYNIKSLNEVENLKPIPNNWFYTTLGEIGVWKAGSTPLRSNSEYYVNGNIPWLKTGDLNNGIIKSAPEFITKKALNETSLTLNPIGTILMAMYGATIGKLGILGIEATTNQACIGCVTKQFVYNKFLFYFLYSKQQDFVKMGVGGAQPNISRQKILVVEFPLPPINEQIRIVEKLESILPILDKLEEDETILSELEKQIPDKIKKSILKNALYGNLTKQDLSDESVDAFIREVNPLFKKKSIVESKYYPYEIPENWRWIYLGDLIPNIFSNKSPKYSKVANENFILGQRNNQDYGVDLANIKYGTDEFWSSNNKKLFLQKGDVLLNTLGGGTIGRSGIFELDGNYLTDGHLFVFRSNNIILQKYLLYYLKFNRNEIERNAAGSTNQIFLRLRDVKQYLFPLPPFEEMKRIVEKLEKLFRTELLR